MKIRLQNILIIKGVGDASDKQFTACCINNAMMSYLAPCKPPVCNAKIRLLGGK